ncbi:MAG: hypothetical protein L6Q77_11275 [Bacteroidetes bacterium]|nr:hypothetical protein [Bacteroidota bacterium]
MIAITIVNKKKRIPLQISPILLIAGIRINIPINISIIGMVTVSGIIIDSGKYLYPESETEN